MCEILKNVLDDIFTFIFECILYLYNHTSLLEVFKLHVQHNMRRQGALSW